jgi:hypothetical protein
LLDDARVESRFISVEVKKVVMLTCVRPIVQYGAEVWAPSTDDEQKWAAIIDVCNLTSCGHVHMLCWLNGV